MSMRRGFGRYALVGIWVLFALFPVYWMAIMAFKQNVDIYGQIRYLPGVDFVPTLHAWKLLFDPEHSEFVPALQNSFVFASVSALLAVIIGAFAAYGLVRYSYRYGPMRNNDLSFLIVSQRMMPPIVAVLALFMIWRSVELLDTGAGMIIIYTWSVLPLTVFLLTDFMRRVPIDVEQAAAVDGYGRLARMWKVTFPLTVPGLAAAYLLAFFFVWNDFLLALMLTFQNARTVPVIIAALSSQMKLQWFLLAAVGLIAMIPPALAVTILDRYMDRQVLARGGR
jgi:multiple sugar transport system permease protein